MAESQSAWGIDIGQAGLKAVRLKYAEAAGQVMAVAFDYVPHAKILSQPDANPEELIAEALRTFLSRNQVKGDVVAISVPGQTALSRFISLPPVDQGKIAEIVKYEAKQQIPFALEDVIWDYQVLGSGEMAGDLILDAEVGLFAMKREQVQSTLAPYLKQKVEVDLIQVGTLALYNYLCHDKFGQIPGSTDPIEEDEFTIVLDMGADNTSLLATNGKKVWVRNIQIGGNQFTRALTKELKQTFAKAEHLKCNATKAEDPKQIFAALRPVFNDYVADIQRSIGYFSSVNKNAKIKKIIGCGNGFKLAGLQKFLQQNLQMDVERVEAFQGLVGDTVLNAQLFQENLPSFVVPYGLALQGLKITRLHTSLLPPEITSARMIRRKKPWMLTAAATLLLGLSTSVMGYGYVLSTVSPDRFKESEEAAKQYVDTKGRLKSDYDGAAGKNKAIREEAAKLVEPLAGRETWIELYKAINESLPRDLGDAVAEQDVQKRNRIRIYSITAERLSDASTWFSALGEREKTSMLKADVDKAPSGVAYLFTLYGRHFHNDPNNFNMQGTLYVTNTMMRALQSWRVREGQPLDPAQLAAFQRDREAFALQAPPGTALPPFPGVPVRQLGITHAVFRQSWSKDVWYSPKGRKGLAGFGAGGAGGLPNAEGGLPAVKPGGGRRPVKPGGPGAPAVVPVNPLADPGDGPIKIKQTDFAIQFLWKETPAKDRPATDPDVQVTLPAADAAAGAEGSVPAVPPEAAGAVPGAQPGVVPSPQPPPGAIPAAPGAVAPGFVPPAAPPPGTPPVAPPN